MSINNKIVSDAKPLGYIIVDTNYNNPASSSIHFLKEIHFQIIVVIFTKKSLHRAVVHDLIMLMSESF